MTDLITRGRHAAVPRSIAFGYAGADDKPQAAVLFEIVGDDPWVGWTITAFLFLHEKSWERSIESFRHMGWAGDDLSELPAMCEAGQLGEVDIVVDHEQYDGQWQAKVKWVNKRGGAGVQLKKPMEGADLSDFALRMKGRIRTVGAGGAGAAGTRRAAGGAGRANAPNDRRDVPPPADDDIPF
jgi:hypothetical protein